MSAFAPAFQGLDEETVEQVLGWVQTVLEYAGTIAFAISGAVVAGRKHMDVVGVVALGVIVAIGGGTIRDLLLQQPVSWIESPAFVVVGALAALVTIPLTKTGTVAKLRQYNLVQTFDAAGMAIFVVTGTTVALAADASPFAAALVGVIAGVGGGIIRDVLAMQIPSVLADGQFYASAALAGSLLYILLLELPISPLVTVWIPVIAIFTIRMLAMRYGWGVPKFKVSADEAGET
ncbi:MAG: TRIC cation channel family protein [Acidimicrobiia bacterium]|nr:TRIC cation channel family protein [Acidimicrobiia bacterium]